MLTWRTVYGTQNCPWWEARRHMPENNSSPKTKTRDEDENARLAVLPEIQKQTASPMGVIGLQCKKMCGK